MAKEGFGLSEVVKDPGKYRLGMMMAELHLPRRQLVNPNGVAVTFNREQNHRDYLYQSNLFPIAPQLERQGSIYAHAVLPDNRLVIVASTTSPYTVEGDHIIVWLPRGDNFMFQPTLAEVSEEQGQKGLGVVANIAAQYDTTNRGRNYYVGMNVQPSEFERQSVQSIRSAVHIHVVRMDDRDIKNLKPLSKLESRHEFADSYTPFSLALFDQIIAGRIEQLPGAERYLSRSFTYQDYPFLYPKAHFFELKDRWVTLGENGFFTFLKGIQEVVSQQYKELADCFTDGRREIFRLQVGNGNSSTDFFRRLLPLSPDEINKRLDVYLAKHSELTDGRAIAFLRYLANHIQSASNALRASIDKIDEETGVPVISAHAINSRMIMEGESYNVLFFPSPNGGKVLMAFVPRVTSGGSPMDAFGLKKQQFVIPDPEEFNGLMEQADKRRDDIVNQLLKSTSYLSPGSAIKGTPLY